MFIARTLTFSIRIVYCQRPNHPHQLEYKLSFVCVFVCTRYCVPSVNFESLYFQLAKVIKQLQASHRLILSGTPIQVDYLLSHIQRELVE